MNKRKRITVSVITELTTDQRVIRICTSLQEMGFDVHVFARRLSTSLPLEKYLFKATRFRCYFTSGVMQYLEFNTKLFFHLLFSKTDYFLANDLDSLMPNYIVSRVRKKYLFYDTHEYFTGVPELKNSPLKRKIWKSLEDRIFPKLKTIYTVNESVKNEYQKEYDVDISVIRNVPVTNEIMPAPLPEHWVGKIIILAQGTGLNTGRNCIEMVEAMPFLDDRFHLVFIGGGNEWKQLQEKRQELSLEHRIDMMDKMLPAKLRTYTALAHLGISLDSFDSKNCLFNLPNKIFDYIQAGVPVFATAIPEIKRIIDQFHCGIYITDTSPKFIAETITKLFSDAGNYELLKKNAAEAAKELCWEKEVTELEAIYKPFL